MTFSLGTSELDEQIKSALEKELSHDFIKLQEVRIERIMDIINDQEHLQSLLMSDQ
jgi:hypothetical protein